MWRLMNQISLRAIIFFSALQQLRAVALALAFHHVTFALWITLFVWGMLQFAAARMTFVICETFMQPSIQYAADFSPLPLKRYQFARSVLYFGRGKLISGRVGVFM